MDDVVISGIGIVPFGYYPDVSTHSLATPAVLDAIDDAGIEWKEVQAAFCGSVYQGTGSGHQVLREIGLTGIPIVNVENACSSGTSAFRLGYEAVISGQYDTVVVLGFEKMPTGPIASTAFRPWQLKMGFNVQPANYALEAMEYMTRYGVTIDDISFVTINNRRQGALNPNARFRSEVTMEQIESSRMISTPFRLFHCAPVADGAACLILNRPGKEASPSRSVRIRAATLCSGKHGDAFYQNGMMSSVKFAPSEGFVQQSAREAYELAGLGPEEVDVLQVYDSMAAGQLWDLENLGFCPLGEAPAYMRKGYFSSGGAKPANTDGGMMSRGHPLGATGTAQIFEIVQQLRGEAKARQVPGARVGLTHAMGAGPNSSVVILQR